MTQIWMRQNYCGANAQKATCVTWNEDANAAAAVAIGKSVVSGKTRGLDDDEDKEHSELKADMEEQLEALHECLSKEDTS